MQTKLCRQCNTVKPLDQFGTQRGKPRHHCKECKNKESREWYEKNKERKRELSKQYKHIKKNQDLQKAYGITLNEYNTMLALQNYSCKICGVHQDSVKRVLCVDHNHTTGKVRGLLCDNCNRSLGLLKDNLEVLRNAVKYLEVEEEEL